MVLSQAVIAINLYGRPKKSNYLAWDLQTDNTTMPVEYYDINFERICKFSAGLQDVLSA